MNKKRHIYADLIHAWAEGAEIEYWLAERDVWVKALNPTWDSTVQYRIKPKEEFVKVRLSKWKNDKRYTPMPEYTWKSTENSEHFIGWVSETVGIKVCEPYKD